MSDSPHPQRVTASSERHSRFVTAFLDPDGPGFMNATQAVIAAGYSPTGANRTGYRLLTFVDIRAAIGEARQANAERCAVNRERVLTELARIAFADIRTFAQWGTQDDPQAPCVHFLPSEGLSDDDVAAVAEVSESVSEQGFRSLKVKLHDKLAALREINKMQGWAKEEATVNVRLGPFELRLQRLHEMSDEELLELDHRTRSDEDLPALPTGGSR
ncbi:MAG TPA: terminase small subunit [Candidatus Xenobia bacterium]|jgi:phage terminase small subunit